MHDLHRGRELLCPLELKLITNASCCYTYTPKSKKREKRQEQTQPAAFTSDNVIWPHIHLSSRQLFLVNLFYASFECIHYAFDFFVLQMLPKLRFFPTTISNNNLYIQRLNSGLCRFNGESFQFQLF